MGGVIQIADPRTRAITATIPFSIPGVQGYKILPCGIRFTPDGKTAVVALGRADRIALIDVATRKVRATIPVGKRVWHLALSPDGTRAYTANGLSNDVSVVDLVAGKTLATVPAGIAPWGAVAAP